MPDANSLTAVCVYPALILTRINKRTRHWMEELAGIKDLGRKIRMEWKKEIRKNLQGHAPQDLVTDCQSQARWGEGETLRQLAWMTAWVGDGQGGCHQQK